MAKCIRCGKSTFARGHVTLADATICTPCFKQLGFKIMDSTMARAWIYDDIKDGKENLERNRYIRAKKHEEWLKEHPDMAAVFDAISDEDEDAVDIEIEENEED